jgi:hypothetical protein
VGKKDGIVTVRETVESIADKTTEKWGAVPRILPQKGSFLLQRSELVVKAHQQIF